MEWAVEAGEEIASDSAIVPRRDPLPVEPFQSEAVGVGKCAKQEHPIAPVVEARATGSESEGQHNVTNRLKAIAEAMPGPKRTGSR